MSSSTNAARVVGRSVEDRGGVAVVGGLLPPPPPRQEMDFLEADDPLQGVTNETFLHRIGGEIQSKVIVPVRDHIVAPLNKLQKSLDLHLEFYLSKFGNPMLLRRLLYVLTISVITWTIWRSGFIMSYSNGVVFMERSQLIEYAAQQTDLNKLETDLHYLASVGHRSGTRGDSYVSKFITDSMRNTGLDSVRQELFKGYCNYPTNNSQLALYRDDQLILEFDLDELNFNPLTRDGNLSIINIVYGSKGTEHDFERLTKAFLLEDDFVVVLHESDIPEIPISQQLFMAEQFNAKGIIFIPADSESGQDYIKQSSLGITQFGTGDALSPSWASSNVHTISVDRSMLLPKIPVLPLSAHQGALLLSEIKESGVHFDNGLYSGITDDLKVHMKVETVLKSRQQITNVVGKMEGSEQNEKAIIIAAARNSLYPGALYPNFGTALLLNVVELLQMMRYRFNWQPLRSIYFISYGGTEFNHIGATEQMELESLSITENVYSFIDISQLGLGKEIEVQCSPLLHSVFAEQETTLNVNTTMVNQYGDWTPFMANGVPVSVLASPGTRRRKFPIDTVWDTFDRVQDQLQDAAVQKDLSDLISYVLGTTLQLVDNPVIPFDLRRLAEILSSATIAFDQKYKNEHHFKVAGIVRSLLQWKKLAQHFFKFVEAWKDDVSGGVEPFSVTSRRLDWNVKLSDIGRKLSYNDGLPFRKFYKNVLFGPPLCISDELSPAEYPWVFPGIRDAIWNEHWALVQKQIDVVTKILNEAEHSITKDSRNIRH
ncbi:putative zinc metalloprotease KNAG_0G02690 [Huiozyma naganishii CBS 8797]|uniref:Transferrin receptor-like dimerisation domain-containing protein n=1 Tax=Huiozyma naganishii (strain ATCC MYA-139 / BCRC 22969 / CBS 8797 / KCTC 17520 / NBRC 10181 / NCYC 3082 / Yp74L-3) TaxID=1071383 RepID=J7R8X3_HUIN7|nr:hypothetical protein KNAG_0G02690 [Kazachstania naganishii CBS 8797]CCK71325.1 hypothetical protein KNAG_0G02690 [Kazachstania naganishii CBS 8797]